LTVHDLKTELDAPARTLERLIDNIETVVLGKREQVELVVAALLCSGHVLLEDVPGTAKTVLARAIAGSIEGAIPSRIQCTPDLQPTDVTGLAVFNQKTREFEFRAGPIFANVLLVDEINRALPKTQSALLEAMAEGQVTIDGRTRELPRPFLLIATENPIEYEGTFPLPEAQLDRFLIRTALGYPTADVERDIVRLQRGGHPLGALEPVVTAAEVRAAQAAIEHVYVDELIEEWVLGLVRATREIEEAAMGASVRGTLAFDRLLRAWALIHERDFVVPDDVEHLFLPVLAHRVVFSPRFLVRTRQIGREAALGEFTERCFEHAPRPAVAAEETVAALDRARA
jgi:MoxR-like ATPase